MNKAKCPPEGSIAIGIAFSYIPVLKNEIGTVIEAQKSRGASFESRNPVKKIKAYIPVIVPGLFISIMKGREIARAIEARGFTYDPVHRTYRKEIRLRIRDGIVMGCSVIFCRNTSVSQCKERMVRNDLCVESADSRQGILTGPFK